MQVPPERRVEPGHVRLRVDPGARLVRLPVEPVRDVLSRGLDQWLALSREVVLNQLRQVVNLVKERHPAVIGCVVRRNLFRSIVSSKFELFGQMLGVFKSGWTRKLGRWYSRCHTFKLDLLESIYNKLIIRL